ncbi:DNRLRE domain-containing protein [Clostridium autoethanogenum]|uniref:DNRLRE domain-containing protein n=1 Tax=Clostridium autoethanogenum DSM 10061 TaxID=1341692 RepID=A0ABN4BGM8_9CLOT|nr:DNRLRE domain-containing protein [Clostridium autoethanogenum]AGY76734.1 DNRLRE domain-containing protein [Clostridium autoethanogenum DSM 10061]ALU36888.1 Transforming growth factor beta (TGFb) [Clostridium autoethanogenum DSM 10061]OVY50422.1 TGF-beta propeptide [Clostridium autoethanogenum]
MPCEKTQIVCKKCITITNSNSKNDVEDNELKVGFTGKNTYRTYMYFNINDISENIVVDSAELEIYLNKINIPHSKTNFYVYPLKEDFDLDTSFENQPEYYEKQVKFELNKNSHGIIHVDITHIFDQWHDNSIKNKGLVLKSREKHRTLASFSSNLSPNYEGAPKLVVCYSKINHDQKIVDVVEKHWELKIFNTALSPTVNVERIINGTFFIENNSDVEIKAVVEVSVDSKHWIEDTEVVVGANKSQVLIAKYYGKYYRVKFNCSGFASAKLNFICQVYQ